MDAPDQIQEVDVEQLINELLKSAGQSHVSDIHIEPLADKVNIRFRIDGILREISTLNIEAHELVLTRLKILSQLDITRKLIPQDGHFEWSSTDALSESDRKILDIRLSTFPTIFGESVVMRILNRTELLMPLEQLGLSKHNEQIINGLIKLPYGMVLTTGPAGSGKTTLLYSALNILASPAKNIITLEDPVEYHLKYVRQSQVSPERDYFFATGMRSILRQDPDVIMIGEIRDGSTAEAAIQASLTGRLLFSTLHADNAVGTIARLLDMKIDPPLIAYSLNGIIAQRLVRKICSNCKKGYAPDPQTLAMLEIPDDNISYSKGEGCGNCDGTGYRGRTGIFEILVVDNEIKRAIAANKPIDEIANLAQNKGLKTLHQDGIEKIKKGITTPEEILRVAI